MLYCTCSFAENSKNPHHTHNVDCAKIQKARLPTARHRRKKMMLQQKFRSVTYRTRAHLYFIELGDNPKRYPITHLSIIRYFARNPCDFFEIFQQFVITFSATVLGFTDLCALCDTHERVCGAGVKERECK